MSQDTQVDPGGSATATRPLPAPRGPLSGGVARALRLGTASDLPAGESGDGAEDRAMALWMLHELHYRGFDDVDDHWEWDPRALGLRRQLEEDLEGRLRSRFATPPLQPFRDDFATAFFDFVTSHEAPSLSRFVQTSSDDKQTLELLRLRSVYHLKEMDPTSWLIPRLDSQHEAEAKAALVEMAYDEYGGGRPERLHAALFAAGLAALDIPVQAHVDEAPLEVLEQNNAMSLFGLHRRLKGAAAGHFAAFEATSSLPSRALAQGLRRLDFPPEMVAYYDEHVEADAVHDQLAVRRVCGSLVAANPDLLVDVLWGAWTCLDLESRVADRLLTSWGAA